MTETTIAVAGLTVRVVHQYDAFVSFSADYQTTEADADFAVTVTPEDIAAERDKSIRECAYERIPYPNYTPDILELTAIYRKIAQKLPAYGALVFHGSAVSVGDAAYLFTAPSGTGKTTHTNLWLKNIEGSSVVNGDKPILRCVDGKVLACGTPWRGKEQMGRAACVPLRAICLLRRGTENTIEPISFSQALSTLVGQTYRSPDREVLVSTLKTLEEIGTNVPLYELHCNMEDEAAFVSYRGMCHDEL